MYPTDHVFIFFRIFIFLQIFLINISMKPEVTQTNYLYTWRTIECFHSIGQGLTQTFMSSGPQDYQLRRSGGPTIFLVVLTTTNVTFTWKSWTKCFHACDVFPHRWFCKTTKGLTGISSRMMIDLNVNNACPSWLQTRVLFRQNSERGYSFSGIIYHPPVATIVYIFGHVTIMTRARYYGGPQDHWIWMFWWSDIISGGLGPPSVVNADWATCWWHWPSVG